MQCVGLYIKMVAKRLLELVLVVAIVHYNFCKCALLHMFRLQVHDISRWCKTQELHNSKIYDVPLERVKPSKCAGLILGSANLLPPLN